MPNILMDYAQFTKHLLINWPLSFAVHYLLGGGISIRGGSLLFWRIIDTKLKHLITPLTSQAEVNAIRNAPFPLWHGLNPYGRGIYTASMLTVWSAPVVVLLWLIA